MKIVNCTVAFILFTNIVLCQKIDWFGPRAGIGNLSNTGDSEMKKGIHSAFGWSLEIPYTSGEFTGYGEGGLMIIGIEQGQVFTNIWGYFGGRFNRFGLGIGPVINPLGIGLGMNLYMQHHLEKIRIPIGLDLNFINNITRITLFIGFNYK